jgi:uncharacterized protein YydD (DUF2326 family)
MYLKFLKIEKDKEIIRHIKFKKGINLIVDTSNIENQKESGNNVGKTTVLKLVDFCLGGNAKQIWSSKQFKQTTSPLVEKFLGNNNVLITLCLGDSFEDNKNDIVIKRNFLKRNKKIAKINEKNYTNNEEFETELNKLIFNSKQQKPTFRQLIPRSIRKDANQMDSVVEYLTFTSKNDYESIYFFLFDLVKASDLSMQKKIEEATKKYAENVIKNTFQQKNSNAVSQSLALVNHQISELLDKKNTFNINLKFKEEALILKETRANIHKITSALSDYHFKLKLYEESIKEIKSGEANINVQEVKALYEDATRYIPNLQKTFDEALTFHQNLISNKVNFISADIPNLKENIEKLTKDWHAELETEKKIIEKQKKEGSLADYELIVSQLNGKYEEKGKLSEELEKLSDLEQSLKESLDNIDKLNENIEKFDEFLQKEITEFNKYFAEYSKLFYGEAFVFSADKDIKKQFYAFNIYNTEGNVGDGKKKGIIAAYDLAFISYFNTKSFERPKFIMHDKIEGIHGNQLKSLIELVNSDEFNGQYIASVLSGKFQENQQFKTYLKENKVLELSQTNKLFKIEQIQEEEKLNEKKQLNLFENN